MRKKLTFLSALGLIGLNAVLASSLLAKEDWPGQCEAITINNCICIEAITEENCNLGEPGACDWSWFCHSGT